MTTVNKYNAKRIQLQRNYNKFIINLINSAPLFHV